MCRSGARRRVATAPLNNGCCRLLWMRDRCKEQRPPVVACERICIPWYCQVFTLHVGLGVLQCSPQYVLGTKVRAATKVKWVWCALWQHHDRLFVHLGT